VIVRPCFKAADLVILGAAGGQHDDWNMGGGLVPAQAAADFDPAGTFDHPVQHDQIRGFFLREQQGFITIGGDGYGIAFRSETEFQQLGQRRIILNQQKARLAHLKYAPSIALPKPLERFDCNCVTERGFTTAPRAKSPTGEAGAGWRSDSKRVFSCQAPVASSRSVK
jgi:hypothetical protein